MACVDLFGIIYIGGYLSVADLRGAQILSISCSFRKIWQNRMLAPPGELAKVHDVHGKFR